MDYRIAILTRDYFFQSRFCSYREFELVFLTICIIACVANSREAKYLSNSYVGLTDVMLMGKMWRQITCFWIQWSWGNSFKTDSRIPQHPVSLVSMIMAGNELNFLYYQFCDIQTTSIYSCNNSLFKSNTA